MKYLITAFALILSFSVQAADIEGTGVLLRGVDKITGRTKTIELPIGEVTTIGNLRITPQRCLKKPPEETPENAAFLTIEEVSQADAKVIFNGWMFSSNPAISAMEDPIYDFWVLECLISKKSSTNEETKEILPTVHTDTSVTVGDLENI